MPISTDHAADSLVTLRQQVNSLSEVHQGLSQQIRFLRTMKLLPGRIEPTDSAGSDLSGRVRAISRLCAQLADALDSIQTQLASLEKGIIKEP